MSDLSTVRSLLFAPADDERKLGKALSGEADAAVADLEDAVPPAGKLAAREVVVRVFAARGSDGQAAPHPHPGWGENPPPTRPTLPDAGAPDRADSAPRRALRIVRLNAAGTEW